MKIVHVIENYYPDSCGGGTETYVSHISKLMQMAGEEVYVLAPRIGSTEQCAYLYDGIKVFRFPNSSNEPKQVLTLEKEPSGLDHFIGIIQELKPDIVHFHTFNRSVNGFHLKAVKKLGVRTVFTPHQAGIFCPKGSLLDERNKRCSGIVADCSCVKCYLKGLGFTSLNSSLLSAAASVLVKIPIVNKKLPASLLVKRTRLRELKCAAGEADRVIAISPWVEKTLRANHVNNVTLIRQGIVPEMVSANHHREDDTVLKLIFVGRIYPIKSIETLLEAIENLKDSERVLLTFACVSGNDEYAIGIKNRARNLQNVVWLENVPHDELKSLLAENDFLVLPSISEMSPLVVLESFAAGTPVIGTDIPPITDEVEDGKNGLFFPTKDASALADIFRRLLSNPGLKTELRKGVPTPRTFKDVVTELLTVYHVLQDDNEDGAI